MKIGRLGRIAVVALACMGCAQPAPPPPPPVAPGEYGDWIGRPHADWPHIALVNQIRYDDANHPSAACGFLLETTAVDGSGFVAATAKHVIRYFKSGSMDSVSFRGSLVEWRMFPKDDPSRFTVLGRLLNEEPETALDDFPRSEDWLLLTIEEPAEGVQALRLRSTALVEGETVFVVGWRYPDEGPQRIHKGRFVRNDDGTVLIDVEALTDNTVPGLSGSPVLDARGYAIGVMSSKAGKLQRLASVDYPRRVLEQTAE